MPQTNFHLKSIAFKFLKGWFCDQIKSHYKVVSLWKSRPQEEGILPESPDQEEGQMNYHVKSVWPIGGIQYMLVSYFTWIYLSIEYFFFFLFFSIECLPCVKHWTWFWG